LTIESAHKGLKPIVHLRGRSLLSVQADIAAENPQRRLQSRKMNSYERRIFVMSINRLSQELHGKSIVSVTNGQIIGKVEDVLLDPETLRVAAPVTTEASPKAAWVTT
jgi:hypothetical protein